MTKASKFEGDNAGVVRTGAASNHVGNTGSGLVRDEGHFGRDIGFTHAFVRNRASALSLKVPNSDLRVDTTTFDPC